MGQSIDFNFAKGCTAYCDSAAVHTKVTLTTGVTDLYGLSISHVNTADSYLQLFDALAANVTVGTTAPTMSIHVPLHASAGASVNLDFGPVGVRFTNGIVYAFTTTATGSSAPTNDGVVNFRYHQ